MTLYLAQNLREEAQLREVIYLSTENVDKLKAFGDMFLMTNQPEIW